MKSGLGRGIVLAILLTLSARGIYASAWQKPVSIDAERDNAFRTGIAFDPMGNAMAVFEQNSDGVYKLYATRYTKKDKRWERPVAIDAATGNAYRGKVASDKTGNAIAVFKQKSKDGYRIYAARYVKDRGWDGPVAIDNGPGLVDGQMVAFDHGGERAVAVFEQHDGKVSRIYANFYTPKDGWKGPVEIDSGINNAYFPYPVFDNQGNLHVIYCDEATDGLDVYVSRYEEKKAKWAIPVRIGYDRKNVRDGLWRERWEWIKKRIDSGDYGKGVPSQVDAGYRDAYAPTLAVNRSGEVTAFFIGWDGEHYRGYSAVYKRDKWGDGVLVDGGPADVRHIRAAINSGGDIAVVFIQWADDKWWRVHSRIFRPDSGWGKVVTIDAGKKTAYNPSIVFTDDGEAVAVWCQMGDKNVKSFANIYREEGGWGKAHRLDDGEGETCGVRVVAGPDGNVIAVFEQRIRREVGFISRIFVVSRL